MKKIAVAISATVLALTLILSTVAVAADPIIVQGDVVLDENGYYILEAGAQIYFLDGAIEEFEGQRVKITGTVEEDEEGRKILIVDVIELAE